MRRWWAVVALGAALVGTAAVGGAWWLHRRNTTTPVPPDVAVEHFRDAASSTVAPSVTRTTRPPTTTGASSAPSTAAPAAQLPAPGVYVYATTGLDSVDALNGARHTYPAETTLTVMPGDCGVRERWTAAQERWSEWMTCAGPDGIRLTHVVDFHSFFGQGTTDVYVCTGDARPASAAAGATWTVACDESGSVTTWRGRVVGSEQLVIGGVATRVEHVVIDLDDGQARDHQRMETWYVWGTDLVAKQSVANDTVNASAVGDVHYHERYDVTLVSLTPRR